MIPTPTYLQFHLVFSLPVLAALWYLAPRRDRGRQRRATAGIAILVAIAYAYTVPWIAYMIRRGAWSYADGAVLIRALSIPLGEYLFVAIQTLVVAFALHRLGFDPTFRDGDFDRVPRAAGALAGIGMLGGGLWLVSLDPSLLYLGGLIAWVGPVLALQWAVGWPYLLARWRTYLVGITAPTVYLWIADRVALASGVWILSDEYTTGLSLLGLPIEEALFFLVTNAFVIQGLLLYPWVVDRWRSR